MILGMSTAAFYGRWETEEAAAAIAGLPLSCAEAFLQTFSEYDKAFARDVRAKLGGMLCTSVHPLGTHFENGLFSRSPRQRRDAMDIVRRVLDAGAELGAKTYVYHGRYNPREGAHPWDARLNAQALIPMIEEAATRGMVIGWENVSWCQLRDARCVREARELLPQARFTLDIKQAMRAGADPFELARAMGDALCNVHVCDWDAGGRLCLPGEGTFDFEGLFALLMRLGYGGPVILEPYLGLITDDEALLRSISFLKEKMEAAAQKKSAAPIDERATRE